MLTIQQRLAIPELCETAKGIAWDTCHKIYILLSREEVEQMKEYGYEALITSDEATPVQLAATVFDWYDNSCGLRFINAVDTEDGNPVFTTIVPQFSEESEPANA